jgi:hypothetical protein
MIEHRTEELPRHDDSRAVKTLSTADLVQRGNTFPVEPAKTATNSSERVPLFQEVELDDFRQRWQNIQTEFVDDPRMAVSRADELVASLMNRLAEVFADERQRLEHDLEKGENVSTEDLRQALRRYRSFFDRLLTV